MVIGVRVSLRDSLRDSCVVDVPWVDDGVNGQQIQQSASESKGGLEEGSYLYVVTCTSTRSIDTLECGRYGSSNITATSGQLP